MSWITPKTDWYGKRNKAGTYTGDHFEVSDALRLKNNALILLDMSVDRFLAASALMDFYPDAENRMKFDIAADRSVVSGWSPTYSGFFDFHLLERIAVICRNLYHCNEGVWNAISRPTGYYDKKDNDYYDLIAGSTSTGYKIRNGRKPEDYIPEVRPIIGDNGLWVDPYYQEFMFNYRELNALERGMADLYQCLGYKKQDNYQMFVWNFGIKKGF